MVDGSIYIVTYLEVAPASASAVAGALRRWSGASSKSNGNLRLDVLKRTAPANQFALVSVWKDQASFEANRDAAHSRDGFAGLDADLITGVDTRVHNALIGGPDSTRGNGSVFVVTHIDVPPPNKDPCIALLEVQVAASRKDSGCVRFEVFQQADRPNHFSVVEAWADRASFDAHIVAGHSRDFRKKLTPLSGGLYDERLYALAVE